MLEIERNTGKIFSPVAHIDSTSREISHICLSTEESKDNTNGSTANAFMDHES